MLYTYKSSSTIQGFSLQDGTVYLLEGRNQLSGNLVALSTSGKVKWKKNFSQYIEIRINIKADGTLYLTAHKKGWYILRINPKTGNTLWSSSQQGRVGIGLSGNVLIPNGNNIEKFSFYKNGKVTWKGTTPSKNNQVKNVDISAKGNVAIVSSRRDLDYYVQVYNSNGKKLLVRKLTNNKEQIGQVLFNDN